MPAQMITERVLVVRHEHSGDDAIIWDGSEYVKIIDDFEIVPPDYINELRNEESENE